MIYQSLRRRKERLESRLREMELLQRGAVAAVMPALPVLDTDDVEDLDEAPDSEVEAPWIRACSGDHLVCTNGGILNERGSSDSDR